MHLIYAGSWDEQAHAAAWEVRRLIDDEGRHPEDIAILVTTMRGTFSRLTAALERRAFRTSSSPGRTPLPSTPTLLWLRS